MKKKIFKKALAFTLAEVLITLSILGVVAAITVPSLINKNTEKQTVTKLKKEYSALTEAYEIALAENGPVTSWFSNADGQLVNNSLSFAKKISKYLKVKNICEAVECGTIPNYSTNALNGTKSFDMRNSDFPISIELSDGAIISFGLSKPTCTADNYACGNLYIDLNGKKEPNTHGKDIFYFRIAKDRFVMLGTPEESRLGLQPAHSWIMYNCKKGYKNNNTASPNGIACAGWVIYKGNMDYLRKDISWD